MVEVNSMWIGDNLSTMEILSIKSHLKVGHKYILWTYSDVKNVPYGVVIKNGNEILPSRDIFAYQTGPGKGSFSAFSNIFRYKLLCNGGWWVDTDVVALKKFEFNEEFVFASELNRKSVAVPTTCVIKMPPNTEIAKVCLETASREDKKTLEWGVIGPKLLGSMIGKFNLSVYVRSSYDFCPINWFDDFLVQMQVPEGPYAVHMWNELWRRKNMDKNGTFDKGIVYERLKEMYLKSNKIMFI